MEIKPSIVGPNLTINPDIIINLVDFLGLPIPAVMAGSRDIVMLFGEDRAVALSVDYCKTFTLKGKTGSNEAEVISSLKEAQVHVRGSYAGLYGSYYIYPIEGGYWIKGTNGKDQMDMRLTSMGTFTKIAGNVAGKKCEVTITMLGDDVVSVRGEVGEEKIEVNIIYGDEGIKVKGHQGDVFLDYGIFTGEDRITVKGITKDGFVNYSLIMESDTEIHVVGKPGILEADYRITLYENGASILGKTGFYKSDYAFVLGEESE
ncbi:MAG: hypothetical protein K8T10_08370 [Candidatus Eremiobacteraeota bacterium]|nr:hypothetical protein [Candidatus Eremiobacteraeota bacterium]